MRAERVGSRAGGCGGAVDVDVLDTIIVTGSRIGRDGFTTPAPVTVVDAAVIETSGFVNIDDILQRIGPAGSDERRWPARLDCLVSGVHSCGCPFGPPWKRVLQQHQLPRSEPNGQPIERPHLDRSILAFPIRPADFLLQDFADRAARQPLPNLNAFRRFNAAEFVFAETDDF